MKTCKDCFHYDVCKTEDEILCTGTKVKDLISDNFKCFKDKSLFIELPCKVGDTVFCIVCYPCSLKISVSEGFVREICFTKEHININIVDCECVKYANLNINVSCEDFDKTVFHTREEAENELKKRGENNA